MTLATASPLSGLFEPNRLERMYYGASSVDKHLPSCLPSPRSKAFIITGSSLATKTPLIQRLEKLLGSHHEGTFSTIKQHAPIAQVDEATNAVTQASVDTLISVGGGSPIDAAKIISYRFHEKSGHFLYHIAIPTTLSAAECTSSGGYTDEKGAKMRVNDPALAPQVVIYDAEFAAHTPQSLWLSTAIRALDHAVESMYNPYTAEAPTKSLALAAIQDLFENLPKCKDDPKNEEYITRLQLASFNSLQSIGQTAKRGLGLSHSIGYALGSPYGIPHGITSCISLAGVVKMKAQDPASAAQLARILPGVRQSRSGDDKGDALKVGDAIDRLVKDLGLESTLQQYGVGEDQMSRIAETATNAHEGDLYDGVISIVKSKL